MDYTLKKEDRGDYIYFHVTGSDSLEVSKAFWREIIETSTQQNYKKILVDEDLEGSVPIGDVYEVITSGLDIGDIRSIKIAFVDKYQEHMAENIFGESVATNRGLNAKVFTNIDEAEQWLRS
jgi:hypothetical protein